MYKNYFRHIVIDICLIFITAVVWNYLISHNLDPKKFITEEKHTPIALIHPSYPANYYDNLILMGASHDVFVGTVTTQIGTKDFLGNPATQFSVEVIKNIKGDLHDSIVVNQEGGYRNGILYQIEDNKLLTVGNVYLLSARYNPDEDTYTLNPHPNGGKLLSDYSSKNAADLVALANQDEKVKTLEAAYPEEKLLDADIAHNNTRNAFKSLDAKSKAAAQSRADEARASLSAKTQ